MNNTPTIAFIGLGIMGKPMAKNLLKAGYSLIVHNRSKPAVDELVNAGAQRADSPKQAAEKSDTIITLAFGEPVPGTDVFRSAARFLHFWHARISELSFSMLFLAFIGI